MRCDPPRLRDAATSVAGSSDTIGGMTPGGAPDAAAAGLPGSAAGPACMAGAAKAAAAFTQVAQGMSGWSAAANANATAYEHTDEANASQVQSAGSQIPGQP